MILERINSPKDLKDLTVKELEILSSEIREFLIKTISKTGGHLASNLGVVELTIAIHYVFDAPKDKIIFDVGHQCYTHKILTERRHLFHSLRQYGGISGFPSRKESPYDVFDTGHASNSISIAVGLAEAKKRKSEDYKVVAIIGDGALQGGQAFEAINHAGHLKSDIIIVLNDNEMSISKSIGALSSYLNRIMTGEFVTHLREGIKRRIRELPTFGGRFYRLAKNLEEAIKGLFGPGMLFEELGLKYVGPIDGHNLQHLIETLKNIKKLRGPIILHVITKKGKGFVQAEEDPARFHGVSHLLSEEEGCYYSHVFGETLIELAERDERIVAITAAMASGTGLERFSRIYPERFYDVGICESHAVTFAAALATQGLRPFVAIYSTFLQRAYDQIVMDVCLQNLPVILVIDRGGIVGSDGPTHHGAFDLSYLRHIPNMTIMAPKDENELRDMLYSALNYERPCAIRYERGKIKGLQKREIRILPYGSWEILREGRDIWILACGNTVYPALAAAEELEKEAIKAGVINGRFVKPVDDSTLNAIVGSSKLLTVEENTAIGGFGSGILEWIAKNRVSCDVRIIGLPDSFIPHGSQEKLRTVLGLSKEGIKKEVLEWLRRE